MESTLRPRDIQARIRAGESAEDVAAVAGTSVEKVMIFASPVLAERAHVARSAQSASVRRRSGESVSQARTLGQAAAGRLRDEGVDPESVQWDAWRREDGRWTLTADYHHEAQRRVARFSFDQPGHFVSAEDDEGRWLVSDGSYPSRAEKEEAQRLRLAPTPRHPAPVELGDDALELVSAGDADWIASTRESGEEQPLFPTPAPSEAAGSVERGAQPEQEVVEPTPEPTPEPAAPAAEAPRPPTQLPRREPESAASRKNRGRASVPSWDEIMFGGGNPQ